MWVVHIFNLIDWEPNTSTTGWWARPSRLTIQPCKTCGLIIWIVWHWWKPIFFNNHVVMNFFLFGKEHWRARMLTHHHQILLRCQPDMNLPISLLHLIPCIKEHRTHDTLQWSTIPNTKRRRTLLHRVAVQHHHSHIYSILFLNFWITVLVGALV